jgi:hypothetical protein
VFVGCSGYLASFLFSTTRNCHTGGPYTSNKLVYATKLDGLHAYTKQTTCRLRGFKKNNLRRRFSILALNSGEPYFFLKTILLVLSRPKEGKKAIQTNLREHFFAPLLESVVSSRGHESQTTVQSMPGHWTQSNLSTIRRKLFIVWARSNERMEHKLYLFTY